MEDAICCRATKSVTKRFQTTLVEDAICCRATKSATKRFQTALSKKKLEITHHWKPKTGSTRKQIKTTEKHQNNNRLESCRVFLFLRTEIKLWRGNNETIFSALFPQQWAFFLAKFSNLAKRNFKVTKYVFFGVFLSPHFYSFEYHQISLLGCSM